MTTRQAKQRPSIFTPMAGYVDRLNRLNRGRDQDVPRRARIKGNWKSKIIELEVWLQENLFQLNNTPMSTQERADAELLVYGAAGTLLMENFPGFKPIINRYIDLLQRLNQPANDKFLLVNQGIGQNSLAQLTLKLEELKEQIRDLDKQFDVKSSQLAKITNDIANKRLEVENLKMLCRAEDSDSGPD